jgi:glycerophosphoryl diester phosphodiesterase
MSLKLPKIIGHRGCAGYAPENTLVGIHTAADMGVEWVELDVKLTKDQVPILFHDELLDRTTDGSGEVKDHTYTQLKELDAGLWFGESFFDTRIPTLEQALDVLIERDLGVNIEIKPCPGRERETAEVALDLLSSVWDDHANILISSFQHVSLEVALEMAEDWARSYCLGEEWPEGWADIAKYLHASAFTVDGHNSTPEQIRELSLLGKPMLAYTINDPDQARALQGVGFHGFFSDEPDVVRDGMFMVH